MLFHIRQRTDLHVPLPQRERGRGYAQSCQRDFPMVVALDFELFSLIKSNCLLPRGSFGKDCAHQHVIDTFLDVVTMIGLRREAAR